jgi:hypothetical protein
MILERHMTSPKRINAIRKFYQWLTVEDYMLAKEEATDVVVKRFSRGNTNAQNGWYLDEAELSQLSHSGDGAIGRLKRIVAT